MRTAGGCLVVSTLAVRMVVGCVGSEGGSPPGADPDASAPADASGLPDGGADGDCEGCASCTDGKKNGTETDIDCGGSGSCPKCSANLACGSNDDCATGSCKSGFCQLVSLPTWVAGPALPLNSFGVGSEGGRTDFVMLQSGGVMFAIGGRAQTAASPSTYGLTGTVDAIDFKSGPTPTWFRMTDQIGPRKSSAGAVGPDGALYIMGGRSADEPTPFISPAMWRRTATLGSETWDNTQPNMTSGREAFAAVSSGPNFIAFGGLDDTGAQTVAVDVFTPSPTPGWSAAGATMAVKRAWHAAAVGSDGNVYVIGGQSDLGFTSLVERFDPKSKTLVKRADMITARARFAAAAAPDGRIYAIGGESTQGGESRVTVEAYSPVTDTWVTVTSLPKARTRLAAAIAPDGRLWVAGGSPTNVGAPAADVQIYGPHVVAAGTTFARGEKIPLSGDNFVPDAEVSVFIDTTSGAPVATTKADGTGAVSGLDVVVPATIAAGAHRIVAVDSLSRYPVSATFTVN